MDFVFDQLDTTNCPHCGGIVEVAGLPAMKLLACPHCEREMRVPGKLGTLLLQEIVGTGSAGIVYKALDVTLSRHVAVKILKNEEGDDKKIAQATVAEARALAAINHPNVVHIHTIGIRHGQPYIVMELLLGSDKLNVMLREGWVADEKRGLEIAIDVAQGLKAAEGAGLLHRDVKPGNILFNGEGIAKLLDFSVVHASNGDGEKVVIGTPYYIAPEAARGQDVDFRADIYSLGATLYHLLAGCPVFDGETSRDVMRARLRQRAPDIRQLKPQTSAAAAGVIARMLATDPAERHASYDELIADLRQALNPQPAAAPAELGGIPDFDRSFDVSAIPVARRARSAQPPPATKAKRMSPAAMGLVGAMGVAAVAGIVALVIASGGSEDPPAPESANVAAIDPARRAVDLPPAQPVTPIESGGNDGGATPRQADPAPVEKQPAKASPQPAPPKPPSPLAAAVAAWERETAELLRRTPTAWEVVAWTAAQSEGGAVLKPQPDGSVLVSGAAPVKDSYVLQAKLAIDPQTITGIRIEALPDATLGGKGPGRAANGNFVLSRFDVRMAPASNVRSGRPFVLHKPAAEFAQPNYPLAGVLDDNPETGWAISPRTGVSTAALLVVRELAAPAKAPSRTPIVFDTFEGSSFSDQWTIAGNAFKDRPFKDGEIVLPGLSGFQGQFMVNSALGTGLGVDSPDYRRGTGTLTSKPFKIERDSIAFLLAGGQKESTRIQLRIDDNIVHKSSGDRSHKLKRKVWDVRAFAGKEAVIEIIDEEEKDTRGYIVVDQIEFTDEAHDSNNPSQAAPEPALLVVTLEHASKAPRHTLGRFRISITTSAAPFLDPNLPPNIRSIVTAGAAGRTQAQADELEAYYRRTKIEGLPYNPP